MLALEEETETTANAFAPLGRLSAAGFTPAGHCDHLEAFATRTPNRDELNRAARVREHIDAARRRLSRIRLRRLDEAAIDTAIDRIIDGNGRRSITADMAAIDLDYRTEEHEQAMPEIVVLPRPPHRSGDGSSRSSAPTSSIRTPSGSESMNSRP